LIRRLDVPVRQVMIEVRIVTATNKFLKDLGVRFGAAKTADIGSGTQFGLGGGGIRANQGTGSTTITTNANGTQTATGTGTPATIFLPKADTSAAGDLSRNLVDLGLAGNPYGALAMTLARTADYVLNLELQALQDQNMGELLSNPKVMTQDRCEATIKQGTQIPYRVSQPGGNAYTVEFKDATLTLNVLPQITPSGSVVMALKVNKDAPLGSTPDGVPIDTRQLETNVHVMDGETVVLGGVFEDIIENNTNKVPFFGDLPGVGFLFKRTHKLDDKKELLIFVTPKIVKDNFTASN
jgi:type IV pilus assembly protein PilQ